jgi:O-antigen ligase
MSGAPAPAVARTGSPGAARLAGTAVLAVCWGAFSFGAAYPWAYWPLAALCVIVGTAGLRLRDADVTGVSRPLLFALGAVALAIAVQLVPLPLTLIERISPAVPSVLARIDFAYGAGMTSSHSLSIDPSGTAVALGLYLSFALLLVGLTRVFAADHVRRAVEALTVVAVALALAGIVQKPLYAGRVLGMWEPQSGGSPFGPFVNKNHFAGWMLMVLPLTLALLCAGVEQGMHGLRPGWRDKVLWLSSPEANRLILLGAAAMLMVLSVVLTMSRSGMSALAMSLVMTGWVVARGLKGRSRRAALVAYVVLVIVTTIAWVGADAIVARFSEASWSEFNNRRGAWADALSVASAFRLVGVGVNGYSTAARFYQSHNLESFFGEAHNDYLQLLAEGGVLLAVPVAVCGLLLLRDIRRRGKEDVPSTTWWLRRGALMGLLAIGLQETVEFSLQMPGNAVVFAVLCAIALHKPREQRPPAAISPSPRPKLRVVASNAFAGSR